MGELKWLKNVDWGFIGILALLLVISLVILQSASANVIAGKPEYYLKKQIIWIIIGLVAMAMVASFDYRYFEKLSMPIYLINLAILLAVLLIGNEAKGAQRWISFGPFDFQPSEFAKIAIVVSFASFLSRRQGELNTFRDLLPCFLFIGAPMLLILKQPDLGTSLVFIAIMIGMLWTAGANPKIVRTLVLVIFLGIGSVFGMLYFATSGFQKAPEQLPIPLPLKNVPADAADHFCQSGHGSPGGWLPCHPIPGGHRFRRRLGQRPGPGFPGPGEFSAGASH